ncbi:unnamed protein product [Phytomonas sp. Hart1]|nr:unnamed protein product [Phytomonas sp. Hart1]|eukprot:CCW67754.1 unnamed protein product [Phytomonas sp. isolate Hart1]
MEQKGDALMASGEKALKKRFFIFKSDKTDSAHDKFIQATTQYKAAGVFSKAAVAFKRAADTSEMNGDERGIALELEESAKMYLKANDTKSAVTLYKRVFEIHNKNQSSINAAKVCAAIGEITEGDEAMMWLDKAAKYYRSQGSKVMSSEVLLKIADSKAQSGDYKSARDIYEEQALAALDDRASRCNARYLFFNALLAQIATMKEISLMDDVEVLKEQFEKYQELETQFNSLTRQHMVITDLIKAIQSENVDAYEDAIREYDNICPLNSMQKDMVLIGKKVLDLHVNDLL